MGVDRKVTVIGAGFSGLVAAYSLVEAGFSVEVFERDERVGGMIQTLATPLGLIETAANGILASAAVENLFNRIGLPFEPAGSAGKRRYIFRDGKPRRWPLGILETLGFVARLPFARRKPPRENETVREWTIRVLGQAAYRFLVTPALQGIYAGNPQELSAELLFGRFFVRAPKRAPSRYRGTIAPIGGMGRLAPKLREYLGAKGVVFHLGEKVSLPVGPAVVATSLPAAVELLAASFPEASQALAKVEMLPLISLSFAYPKQSPHLSGFGCLFARGENIRSLGVLFEESVFPGRSEFHLERWILGGATDPEVFKFTESELLEQVLSDRAKLLAKRFPGERISNPLFHHLSRWEKALPHCTLSLKGALEHPRVRELATDKSVYLLGNFTGKLGLSGILENAAKIATALSEENK